MPFIAHKILIIMLLIAPVVRGQNTRNYIIVKPPQTDSLAILKIGGQIPFAYQFSLGYHFTKTIRIGVGLGFIDGPNPSMLSTYNKLGDRTYNQSMVLDQMQWRASTSHISMAYAFESRFYLKADLEALNFEPTVVPIYYFENENTQFNAAFPDLAPIDKNTGLYMGARQTYFSLYLGAALFHLTKRLYTVSEIGIKSLIGQNYNFAPSASALDDLDQSQQDYLQSLKVQMKANFNRSPFIPVINFYLVYKLKTCDCM